VGIFLWICFEVSCCAIAIDIYTRHVFAGAGDS
jgi:hypothetical protein